MKCGVLRGRGSRIMLVGCFLLLVFCSAGYSDDIATLSTAEIVAELTSIVQSQTLRLTELETLLERQKETARLLRLNLTALSASYMRLQTTMNELNDYSQNLEREVEILKAQRKVLLWGLGGSIGIVIIGLVF